MFGSRVEAYLDGGPAAGEPSTVFSLVGEPHVVRAGAIEPAEIDSLLGS
jgi:tRNA A37 threonylcarbamoyladenosine synthetase subunit TsaC/SUA5/YrdC